MAEAGMATGVTTATGATDIEAAGAVMVVGVAADMEVVVWAAAAVTRIAAEATGIRVERHGKHARIEQVDHD
jgi:hypothetical protein